ncbi:MAG: phosphatase PAP2 family protein [Propionibacteriaceae bacterium]|uniref:NAD+ kinase n=1 Tax=Propionibacterium ruminifibrarum TaxID=1962131 RepID=A0A375I147_9ACTN|nr:diacylglycerol kinase family protein [Propionibacterium ruminifibrarum]MBE6476626.1 phosphatase PAP2 family protein [Propionibacteriaceae bacterium]SPF67816.1 NAD+ kinase [Propionibacterium ruminifibrarum]
MTTRTFSRFNLWIVCLFALAFIVWTHLTLRTRLLARLDALSQVPHLMPGSAGEQIGAAFALVTHPVIVCLVLAGLSVWAWRRRLRHLAVAILASGLGSWLACVLLKNLFGRPRPPSPLDWLLTYRGPAYPSTHMAVIVAGAMTAIAVSTTTRQSRLTILSWRVVGVLAILLEAADRFAMNAHRLTDIVGGALLGGLVTSLVLFLARVRMLPLIATRRRSTPRPVGGLCAVIYNPIKVADEMVFRRQIADELSGRHWQSPLWLQTTPEDPGAAQAREAITRGADLVIVAGGDGTVRIVTQTLAGSGIPIGLIPAGTGNLLAKNLGLPLDQEDAIFVAINGQPKDIDLIRLVVDGRADEPHRFAVMAGIGFDARLMARTNDALKKMMGTAAYVVSAMPELLTKPHRVQISVDGSKQVRGNAVLTVMGNVPSIGGNVILIPDSDPTDGRMEMVVGSPSGISSWARMATRVLTRIGADRSLERYAGRSMSVRVDEPMPFELDGDTVGEGSYFKAEVDPAAVSIMVASSPANHSEAAA